MSPVIEQVVFWGIVATMAIANLPPLALWVYSKIPARPEAPPVPPQKTDATAELAHRSPGDVLDCLRCDMQWLLANTDATDADVAPVEALAKFLIHTSKTTAKAGA